MPSYYIFLKRNKPSAKCLKLKLFSFLYYSFLFPLIKHARYEEHLINIVNPTHYVQSQKWCQNSHLYSVDFKFVINGLPTLSIINQNDNPQYKVAQLNCPGEITIIHTKALFIKNRRFQPANNCKEPGKLNFDVV